MEVVKFNLSGNLACFRKATTVNGATERVLTYDLIPLTVVKGIIGAILGYNGLAVAYRMQTQPEYMDRLADVSIGIVPIHPGVKFIQSITNTTGFANKGGATAIIEQEVLADVSYDIYVTNEFSDFDELCKRLEKQQPKYPVVLGRKGMIAQFSKGERLNLEVEENYSGKLSSLVYYDSINNYVPDYTKQFAYDLELPTSYNDLLMYETRRILYEDTEISYGGNVLKESESAHVALL
ncbi:MAG: CRISPR-associated protein Cas5 [Enterococcus sp.]